MGQEDSVEEYVTRLADQMNGARDALKPTGTCWFIIGDSYINKRLQGVPWLVAQQLGARGWIVRSDVIWQKSNPVPESVKDRPVKSHEHVFLLTKTLDYHYDVEGYKEPAKWERWGKQTTPKYKDTETSSGWMAEKSVDDLPIKDTKPARDVWKMPTSNYRGEHYATFPEDLVERCLRLGCPPGGFVLDPFAGVGTALTVARDLGMPSAGIEKYRPCWQMGIKRIAGL